MSKQEPGQVTAMAGKTRNPRAGKKARGSQSANAITKYAFLDVELVNETEELREKIRGFIAKNFDTLPTAQYQMQACKVLYRVRCTDTGNATRMYARYGRNVRYVGKWGMWYIWNGRVWAQDTQHLIMEYAKVCASYVDVEADCLPIPADKDGNPVMCPNVSPLAAPKAEEQALIDAFERREAREQELRKWSKQSCSRRSLEAAIELLKSEPGITVEPAMFDTCDHLLNCRNGTFDLHAGSLLPHNREHFITKIANVSYTPGATCSRWETFLTTAMYEDKDSVNFIKELVGEGLSGKKLDDIMAIFHGPGGNGKTVFVETLKEMLGDYAGTANADLFLEKQSESISNDVARLVGVRFLTASETKEGRALDESLVKQLTGGDMVTARFLRQEFFEFTPKFTPILLTNPKPVIRGTDNGIWRRVKLVPWLYDFEDPSVKRDKPEVLAELREEHAGILNWAIAGYQARVQRGKLFIPAIVETATVKYRRDSDTLGKFLEDCCFVDIKAQVPKKELYIAYKNFVEENGGHALADNKFSTKLQERPDLRGLDEKKSGSTRFWLGIRLRNENDTVAPVEPKQEVKKPVPPVIPTQAPLREQEEPAKMVPAEEEEAVYIPLPTELTMYPHDIIAILEEQGVRKPLRPCAQHKRAEWLPYYNATTTASRWQYECSQCYPALHSSSGAHRYFSEVS